MKLLLIVLFLLVGIIESSAQFTVEPESVVQAEGLVAVFECLYPGATSYTWIFNGNLNNPNPPQGAVSFGVTTTSPERLIFSSTTLEFNNTVVQCFVTVSDASGNARFEISNSASLQVQESLSAATNLTVAVNPSSRSELIISWSAPFSLDLTTADPDIQYCVDVYNVTGGGSHHLDSVCGITDTQYTYTAPDPTVVYNFTVTPRSNINGSLNGTTSQPVQFSYVSSPVSKVDFRTNTDLSPLQLRFPSPLIQSCQEPIRYSVDIKSVDNLSSVPCHCSTSESEDGDMIALELDCRECDIQRHQRFNLLLFSNGVFSEHFNFTISTHDAYKVTDVRVSLDGQVEIDLEYLQNSTDKGFFIILHSSNHTVYRVANRTGNEPSTSVIVSELRNNVYRLAVYDLNEDTCNFHGFLHPEDQPAVLPEEVVDMSMIDQTTIIPQPTPTSDEVNLFVHDNGSLCMICYSPGLSGCVGVIHSAPLDTYNLTVLTARAGVEECTSERFQGELSVAVFDVGEGGLGNSPSHQVNVTVTQTGEGNSLLAVIILPLIVVGTIMVSAIIVIFVIVKKRKTSVRTQSPPPPIGDDGSDGEVTTHGSESCLSSTRSIEHIETDPQILREEQTSPFSQGSHCQQLQDKEENNSAHLLTPQEKPLQSASTHVCLQLETEHLAIDIPQFVDSSQSDSSDHPGQPRNVVPAVPLGVPAPVQSPFVNQHVPDSHIHERPKCTHLSGSGNNGEGRFFDDVASSTTGDGEHQILERNNLSGSELNQVSENIMIEEEYSQLIRNRTITDEGELPDSGKDFQVLPAIGAYSEDNNFLGKVLMDPSCEFASQTSVKVAEWTDKTLTKLYLSMKDKSTMNTENVKPSEPAPASTDKLPFDEVKVDDKRLTDKVMKAFEISADNRVIAVLRSNINSNALEDISPEILSQSSSEEDEVAVKDLEYTEEYEYMYISDGLELSASSIYKHGEFIPDSLALEDDDPLTSTIPQLFPGKDSEPVNVQKSNTSVIKISQPPRGSRCRANDTGEPPTFASGLTPHGIEQKSDINGQFNDVPKNEGCCMAGGSLKYSG